MKEIRFYSIEGEIVAVKYLIDEGPRNGVTEKYYGDTTKAIRAFMFEHDKCIGEYLPFPIESSSWITRNTKSEDKADAILTTLTNLEQKVNRYIEKHDVSNKEGKE